MPPLQCMQSPPNPQLAELSAFLRWTSPQLGWTCVIFSRKANFWVKVFCTCLPAAVAQLTPRAPFNDAPSSGLDLCYFELKVYFLVKVVCISVPAAVAQ